MLSQAEYLLHSMEQPARNIGLYVNLDETEFIYFNQDGAISLNGKPLKSVDQFLYSRRNISSTERDVYICIGKAWTAIDRLITLWKSDLSDRIN